MANSYQKKRKISFFGYFLVLQIFHLINSRLHFCMRCSLLKMYTGESSERTSLYEDAQSFYEDAQSYDFEVLYGGEASTVTGTLRRQTLSFLFAEEDNNLEVIVGGFALEGPQETLDQGTQNAIVPREWLIPISHGIFALVLEGVGIFAQIILERGIGRRQELASIIMRVCFILYIIAAVAKMCLRQCSKKLAMARLMARHGLRLGSDATLCLWHAMAKCMIFVAPYLIFLTLLESYFFVFNV